MSSVNKNIIKVFECVENAIKSNEPFIYLKRNISVFEAIPMNNLYGVICDLGDSSIHDYGIPSELIDLVDLSLDAPSIKYVKESNISYYSPIGYDTKENVLNIIKLFNLLPSTNLTIYITKEIYNYVNHFSNENITFSCYNNPNELTISTSTMITFGYYTRSFIEQEIPTIVIGPYGIGGWVTPENLSYLCRDNFKGRPGGAYNELIPLDILVDELMEIKEEKDIDIILSKNFSLLDAHLSELTVSEIKNSLNVFRSTFTELQDTSQRLFLKPKLASNIDLIKTGEVTFVQRRVLNDLLFSIPESEVEFLEDLNNNLSCKDLKEKYNLDDDEFWDIIIPLWERKAIVFIK